MTDNNSAKPKRPEAVEKLPPDDQKAIAEMIKKGGIVSSKQSGHKVAQSLPNQPQNQGKQQ